MGPFSSSLSTLIYHRVLHAPDPLFPEEVWAEQFNRQLEVVKRWFTVLPLSDAVALLRAGRLPRRAACITFDDGYADNAVVALPILRRQGVPATFFVATGFIDGGRMWNDSVIETVRSARGDALDARCVGLSRLPLGTPALRRGAIDTLIGALKYLPIDERQRRVDELATEAGGALPSNLMMTWEQVRELHAGGMEIGGHTVSHPILPSLPPERAGAEIREGKQRLEAIIGAPVTLFAYPNGKPGRDYRPEHVAMVRDAGFQAAVSTAYGVSNAASDFFQLPRFTPWDKTSGKFLLRLMHNTFHTRSQRV